ncbi:MAG: DUF2726 domain-containing protein [Planctomycetota bacterium]
MSKKRTSIQTNKDAQTANEEHPYISRKTLLTPGERRFYVHGLRPAIEDRYHVSFKVRLADVLATETWNSSHGRRIAQKHLDFVLVTPTATRIVAAIELNDSSHEETNRRKRDHFVSMALAAAGIPLIGFPIFRKYEPKKIRHHIITTIQTMRNSSD